MPSTDQPAEAPCTTEVDRLLTAIARRGFTMRYCNGPQRPTLIVGTYDWGTFTDLVVIRDIDVVISARIPTAEVTDVFAPEVIVWLYASDAERALQALLDLPPPKHPLAPTTPASAPIAVHVPTARQAPVTIRPPAVKWPGTPEPSRSHDSTCAPTANDCTATRADPRLTQTSQQVRINRRVSWSGPISTPAEPSPDLELMERVRERLHHL